MSLVLRGGPSGPADCWFWFVLALTVEGQKESPTLLKEDNPSWTTLQLSWDPQWKWIEFSINWSSVHKTFIFLRAKPSVQSVLLHSLGQVHQFHLHSPWRAQSFMGVTAWLLTALFPKSLAELRLLLSSLKFNPWNKNYSKEESYMIPTQTLSV